MKKVLIIDPFSGTSGDMFLAALIDLGVPFDAVRDSVLRMRELEAVTVEVNKVTRGVFTATRIDVNCPRETRHRSISDIRKIIEASHFEDRVKEGISKTFEALTSAEAKVHGCEHDKVHFHEVGACDAMFDIFGAHVALDLLDHPVCLSRPIVLGTGHTRSDHGDIPLPAPATLELLAGHKVIFSDRHEELVTPTGAAILASVFKPLPSDVLVTPDRVGYGAGTREGKGLPNVLRVFTGSIDESPAHVCIVTSTIDDMNPEVYGYVLEQLLARGSLDVYYNPVMMKKNRPGVEITVISEESTVYDVANFLMSHTTTLGVRIHREERLELRRRKDSIDTPHGTVVVKVAERPDGTETMSPEYESCKVLCEKTGLSLIEVYEAARNAWNEEYRRR
jgi:uncharacterized protein (TIGR00299 family) protein